MTRRLKAIIIHVHAGIDFNISVFLVDQLDSLLNVDVDALVDQSLSVGVLLADVKSIA